MRKLSLDETWQRCMAMWRWIGKQIRAGSQESVGELKGKWLDKHDPDRRVEHACYFCAYGYKHADNKCKACPAKGGFLWCESSEWEWSHLPLAFLAELESLYKQYKKQKKGRK